MYIESNQRSTSCDGTSMREINPQTEKTEGKSCWYLFMHHHDVIIGAIASEITSLTIAYAIVYSDAENIKAPRHWLLCGEFTGDRWIPRTNGQSRGKYFHLMTSSWRKYPLDLVICRKYVKQVYSVQCCSIGKFVWVCLNSFIILVTAIYDLWGIWGSQYTFS